MNQTVSKHFVESVVLQAIASGADSREVAEILLALDIALEQRAWAAGFARGLLVAMRFGDN